MARNVNKTMISSLQIVDGRWWANLRFFHPAALWKLLPATSLSHRLAENLGTSSLWSAVTGTMNKVKRFQWRKPGQCISNRRLVMNVFPNLEYAEKCCLTMYPVSLLSFFHVVCDGMKMKRLAATKYCPRQWSCQNELQLADVNAEKLSGGIRKRLEYVHHFADVCTKFACTLCLQSGRNVYNNVLICAVNAQVPFSTYLSPFRLMLW